MMLSVGVQERQLSLNKLLQSLNFRIWVRTQLGGGVQKLRNRPEKIIIEEGSG